MNGTGIRPMKPGWLTGNPVSAAVDAKHLATAAFPAGLAAPI